MPELRAALPMYPADRTAVETWWAGLARALRAEGLDGVPRRVTWPQDLHAHWRDPRLLLSQTCGLPLSTTLKGSVQVVGAFRYDAPGCTGIHYRSELLARRGEGTHIEDFRGRLAAINSRDSHSGFNALRGLVAPLAVDGAFFRGSVVSGSHEQSLAALRTGAADIAAVDCVSLAMLRRQAPGSLDGLIRLGSTASAPGLPLITAGSRTVADLAALRRALTTACRDPDLAGPREALFIRGFEPARPSDWQVVDDIRQLADQVFGPNQP